jgi:hypothetical protein
MTTPLTTLNTVVVAPMPSATDRTTVRLKAGFRRSILTA